jgi:hypothetical protein
VTPLLTERRIKKVNGREFLAFISLGVQPHSPFASWISAKASAASMELPRFLFGVISEWGGAGFFDAAGRLA